MFVAVAGGAGLSLAIAGGFVTSTVMATGAVSGPVCPRTAVTPQLSDDPAAMTALVPSGASSVLLCRYRGLNPDPRRHGTLADSRLITAARVVRQLSRRLDALPSMPPGTYSCPSDDASELIAFFHYRRSSDDPVIVQLLGCGGVTNGYLHRWTAKDPGPRLERQLLKLTHCKRSRNPTAALCQD